MVYSRNPGVVPGTVQQISVILGSGDERFADIDVPLELRRAVPKRQLHFRAARYCALTALRALAPGRTFETVPRDRSGAPIWPDGFTGSLTHTEGFASAAVASTCDAAAIGIDTEEIISAPRAGAVLPAVAWACELAAARRSGCDRLAALTLVFSIKETIFKCLYSRVGRTFDFHDVRVVDVDARAHTFVARVVKTLSPAVAAGMVLQGQFDIDERWVHTGLVMPPGGTASDGVDHS